MNNHDLRLLKNNDQKLVRLHMKDGEIAVVKVLFVSESEEDVIADLLSSTCLDHYEKSDEQPAFLYKFSETNWVEPCTAESISQIGNPGKL